MDKSTRAGHVLLDLLSVGDPQRAESEPEATTTALRVAVEGLFESGAVELGDDHHVYVDDLLIGAQSILSWMLHYIVANTDLDEHDVIVQAREALNALDGMD